jgi:hypothetical protein
MLNDKLLKTVLDCLVAVNLFPQVTRVFNADSYYVANPFCIKPVKEILHVFTTKRPKLAYSRLEFKFPLAVSPYPFQDDFNARKRHVL